MTVHHQLYVHVDFIFDRLLEYRGSILGYEAKYILFVCITMIRTTSASLSNYVILSQMRIVLKRQVVSSFHTVEFDETHQIYFRYQK